MAIYLIGSPPTTPAIAAVATSSSAIQISLSTPSLDYKGNPIASYTLERATNAGFSANLITSTGVAQSAFPLAIGGLLASTQYFFRLRAVDVAGNVGQYSSTANATTQSGAVTGLTFTQNLATEDDAGMDGFIAWQTAFLLNDGRIASFGTGNHQPDQNNGVRIIDPVTTPGSVTSYYEFPWTQVAVPPFWNSGASNGTNRYASNLDNHVSMYLPSEDKAIWADHGVFDFVANTWIFGDRSPNTQGPSAFIDITAIPNIFGAYNPAHFWCSALDVGGWYGNSAGGFGQARDRMALIERTTSGPKAWRLRQFSISGVPGVNHSRNESVCVGPFLYLIGNTDVPTDELADGPIFMRKIDLRTETLVATLTPPTKNPSDEFPQVVYDPERQKIVRLGWRLQEYDIATNTWSDITPSGWPGYWYVAAVYHPTNKKIYFRGVAGGTGGLSVANFRWHSLTFPPPAAASRWTLLTIDTNASPFQGLPEESFGGAKHVWTYWDPPKARVYTFGGDYGNGAGQFGQPNMGATFTTNDPVSPTTYSAAGEPGNGHQGLGSLQNDQYSINPYQTGTVPWRLEHPYLPRNLSGVREVRPGRPDQMSIVWDPVRQKRWGFQTKIRHEDQFIFIKGGLPDPWANGDMTASALPEPIGTWSFAPGASGSPGTWTLETSNCVKYRAAAGTVMEGGNVVSDRGDERLGIFTYDAKNDVMACMSSQQSVNNCALYIFKPATKTCEVRLFSVPGYSRLECSTSYCAIIDGWAHSVAVATTSGGTRQSVMIRLNVTAALALANLGTVPASAIEAIVLPWSLSPTHGFDPVTGAPLSHPSGLWEGLGKGFAKWQEHCGVLALNRKIVLICSYDNIIDDNGTTKLSTWSPDTRTFTAGQACPEAAVFNSWCALPETNEVFMSCNTSGGDYSNLRAYRYRVD